MTGAFEIFDTIGEYIMWFKQLSLSFVLTLLLLAKYSYASSDEETHNPSLSDIQNPITIQHLEAQHQAMAQEIYNIVQEMDNDEATLSDKKEDESLSFSEQINEPTMVSVVSKPASIYWIQDQNNCIHYNPSPKSNETMVWSGSCTNNYASGSGTIHWFTNNELSMIETGYKKQGKFLGRPKQVTMPMDKNLTDIEKAFDRGATGLTVDIVDGIQNIINVAVPLINKSK